MRTLFDAIWARHVVDEDASGKSLLYVDRIVIDDVRAPQVLANLERRRLAIRRPQTALVTQDHSVPSFAARAAVGGSAFTDATREAARRAGLRLLDVGAPDQGISHVIAPEQGFVVPGCTYVCVDSHAPTVGGVGALGLGCGSSELEHVLATQTIWLRKPRSLRLRLEGELAPGVGAKDVMLRLIATYGVAFARNAALEFAGPVVRRMHVEGRLTLCNMAVEFGARTALVAPDAATIAWMAARSGWPEAALQAIVDEIAPEKGRGDMAPDVGAGEEGVVMDCASLAPQITWGLSPAHAIDIDGRTPEPTNDAERRALSYMGLYSRETLLGAPVQRVFIGSCTNARASDLAAAAAALNGRRVEPGVIAVVVPGSAAVAREAARSGVRDALTDAGFLWGAPGCSMCAGGGGESVAPGERVLSTANRNFENRQGPGVRTHLVSPATAAASAVCGRVADPRWSSAGGGA